MTEADIRENLSRNIKTFRSMQNMSQAELAEKADISVPFLSQIECANKFPSPVILAKISNALGVTVSQLFAEKGDASSADLQFVMDAMKSILDGQLKSFELFCQRFSSN